MPLSTNKPNIKVIINTQKMFWQKLMLSFAVFKSRFVKSIIIQTFTIFSGAKYMATFEPRCIRNIQIL